MAVLFVMNTIQYSARSLVSSAWMPYPGRRVCRNG